MNNLNSRARRVTKDIVYYDIKQKIITGELEPDQSLIEETIAAELQISRTPLREALQRLEMEELVVRQPNGRLKIASISKKEVQEIFMVRSMLEGIIAKDAAKLATEKDVQALTKIVEHIEQASKQGNNEDIIFYGSQFHNYLYELSGNKTAIKILNMLNDHISRYRRLIPKHSKGRGGKTFQEHQNILNCIAAKDGEAAESAIQEHIMNSLGTAIESIEKYEKDKRMGQS